MKLFSLLGCGISLTLVGCATHYLREPELAESSNSFERRLESVIETEEGTRVERFTIHSDSMNREIKVVVVLPPAYAAEPDRTFPVLYTLHGANAPYDTYANMPKLRAQLKDKPFIYTCFDADGGSGYIDSYYPVMTARRSDPDKAKRLSLFTTFFFEEFIPAIDEWYRVNGSKRGITGFSMGGGGAFHYMLEQPELFNSVSGLSSAFSNFDHVGSFRGGRRESMLGSREAFPERYRAVDHYYRFKKLIASGESIPAIYLHCGTEDRLLELSREMEAFLRENEVEFEYLETPGEHNWAFWHPASEGMAAFHWKYFSDELR